MKRSRPTPARGNRPGRLARFAAWYGNHLLVARDSLGRMRRAPLQSGLMIAVIAIACTLPASLYLLATSVKDISGHISRSSDIQVFFATSADMEMVSGLAEEWQGWSQIQNLEVIDPETGREEFERYSGLGSVLELIEDNPLPAVVRLTPSEDIARDRPALESLVSRLQAFEGIDEVQFDFAWLERLDALLNLVDRINLVVGILLGSGIVLVLINSIRLMIDNRRDEIIIVKLVGGTNDFVRRPLLYTGFWFGLLGGIVAVVATDISILLLGNPFDFLLGSYGLDSLSVQPLNGSETLGLLALSSGLGLLGAWLAVAQHLDEIEPH